MEPVRDVRRLRLAERIKAEVGDVLRRLKDPRLGFASVVSVDLSGDLRHARIFISVLGDDASKRATMAALEHAKGHVRSEVGRRVRMRHTPEIQFVLDESIEHGARISRLLREMGLSGGQEDHGHDER